jgi:N-succinyldiaminopimelate aminotransferase
LPAASTTTEAIVGFCREAERLGYTSLWVQDHFLWPLAPKRGYAGRPGLPIPKQYQSVWAPTELLAAAAMLGRTGFPRLVAMGSLSKRSNCPGMRSGFIAGDAALIERFLLYRTYHGCAMSPAIQAASVAAWTDEFHVVENRRLYREKFSAVIDVLSGAMPVQRPDGGFYLWLETQGADTEFARALYQEQAVTVLPGSYLAREAHGINPGLGRVRAALVAPVAECVEAARRLAEFVRSR